LSLNSLGWIDSISLIIDGFFAVKAWVRYNDNGKGLNKCA